MWLVEDHLELSRLARCGSHVIRNTISTTLWAGDICRPPVPGICHVSLEDIILRLFIYYLQRVGFEEGLGGNACRIEKCFYDLFCIIYF